MASHPLLYCILIVAASITTTGCDKLEEQQTAKQQKANLSRSQYHFKSALRLYQNGQLSHALMELGNAAQLDENNIPAAILYATIFYDLGYFGPILDMDKHFQGRVPEIDAYAVLALIGSGDAETALQRIALLRQDERRKNDPQLIIMKARAYLTEGKIIEANTVMDAISLEGASDETLSFYYISLSELRLKQERLKEAQLAALKAEDFASLSIDAKLLEARSLYAQGQYEKAERQLSDALLFGRKTDIITTQRLEVITLLRLTLIKQGRVSEAMIYSQLMDSSNQ